MTYTKYLLFSILVVCPSVLSAQGITRRIHQIDEVTVWGKRPMKEIGVQKTKFDSLALKENIALSMADILTFNSSVFVKSYGRATLSTVAFRGTSPSHTQVTWNGMRINNPMLGMTDFSTIPSYFIDQASLLHGTSSVNETGGGLGGLVKLGTAPEVAEGFNAQYVQGIGSFKTFDEFARFTYGSERWHVSTRAVYSSSPNDYKYTNHDKKINIYDEDKNIVGQYHPVERNRSGAFKDLHLLQEVYYDTRKGDKLGLNAWYIHSNRELPMLTTDYGDATDFENRQREQTFRGVVSWDHIKSNWKVGVKGGYIHTWMAYDYKREVAPDNWASMTRSRSKVNTFYGQAEGEYSPSKRWFFTANVSLHQHLVRSEDKNIILQDGNKAIVGYDKGRVELSGSLSAKWQPIDRMGLSVVLREEMYGAQWTPLIPAFYADYLISKRGTIRAKASVSRNYRYPTLNDLYFQPGGNTDLVPESGFSYDGGISFAIGKEGVYSLHGEATWFDSYIDDWILWLPLGGNTNYWTPLNMKDVHAYGVELKAGYDRMLSKEWQLGLDGNFSWTPSVNRGEAFSKGDRSLGRQLPYVPVYSAAVTGRLAYKSWRLLYKWCYYSERFTMTSNAFTYTGNVPYYLMNDVTLEKLFSARWADLSVKAAVKNLFDEEYVSVLGRPMPGINFEIFLDIRPKWGKKKARD